MASGIRATQEGADVGKSAEYQKILDERWPFLEFDFIGEVSVSGSVSTNSFIPIHTHKLGFLPGCFIFIKSVTGAGESDVRNYRVVDDKIGFTIYTSSSVSYSVTAFIMVVNRDITKEFTSESDTHSVFPSSGPQRHGVAVLKDTVSADVLSKSKKHFSLNTNAKSLGIHKHGISTAVSGIVTIVHDMGYPPTYFITQRAVESGSANPLLGKTSLEPLGNGSGISSSTTTHLTIQGAQAALSGDFAYLLLKDPVELAI